MIFILCEALWPKSPAQIGIPKLKAVGVKSHVLRAVLPRAAETFVYSLTIVCSSARVVNKELSEGFLNSCTGNIACRMTYNSDEKRDPSDKTKFRLVKKLQKIFKFSGSYVLDKNKPSTPRANEYEFFHFVHEEDPSEVIHL